MEHVPLIHGDALSPGQGTVSIAHGVFSIRCPGVAGILDALQALRAHDEFITGVLDVAKDILPNDMLSYNELVDADRETITTWDAAELARSATVVWTPAAPAAGLSVDEQRWLATKYLSEHPAVRRGTRTLYRNSDMVERAAWQRSVLYNELHRPLGIEAQCNVHMPALPGRMVTLTYSREHGDFSDGDVQWLERVQKVLRRSFHDHWR